MADDSRGLGTRVLRLADREQATIGRSPGCEILLAGDNLVSGRHAVVTRRGDRLEVSDRSGPGGLGIYLAGGRVTDVVLEPNSRFSIGRHDFYFDGECIYQHDDMGALSFSVDDLDVDVRGRRGRRKRVVHDASFVLWQRTLLGVIGITGSGKSSLLKAITGLVPSANGSTTLDGRDLYADYAELRSRIGVVPQDDVLHRALTVRQELIYAAALRLAPDKPRQERKELVDRLIDELGLTEQRNQRIRTLAGGQRKRTSVALELLTAPSLLALDEPTTGLDPAHDRLIMEKLAILKQEDRIIIVASHNPTYLGLCDHLLVICRGRVVYFGPPGEKLFTFFGVEDYPQMFSLINDDQRDFWHKKFLESDVYREYLGPALTRMAASPPPERARRGGVQDAPTRTWVLHPFAAASKFFTLLGRGLRVAMADRAFFALLVLVPVALAGLSRVIPGHGLTVNPTTPQTIYLLMTLVVGSAFLGLINSIREIVKEELTYRRERAAGLSPGLYLLSKFVVLALLGIVQSVIFVWLTLAQRTGPGPGTVLPGVPELMLGMAATTVTCTALGLAISALVRSSEQAMVALIVVLMGVFLFSGTMPPLIAHSTADWLSFANPARWGFAAVASTTGINSVIMQDRLWQHDPTQWYTAIGALVAQGTVFLAAARLLLRRLEPGRRPRS